MGMFVPEEMVTFLANAYFCILKLVNFMNYDALT